VLDEKTRMARINTMRNRETKKKRRRRRRRRRRRKQLTLYTVLKAKE
jgi:hypothetical protein